MWYLWACNHKTGSMRLDHALSEECIARIRVVERSMVLCQRFHPRERKFEYNPDRLSTAMMHLDTILHRHTPAPVGLPSRYFAWRLPLPSPPRAPLHTWHRIMISQSSAREILARSSMGRGSRRKTRLSSWALGAACRVARGRRPAQRELPFLEGNPIVFAPPQGRARLSSI